MSKASGNSTQTISEGEIKASALLNRNLQTVERELEKIEKLSIADKYPLAPEHASALVNYAKTLVLVDKNRKENPDEDETDDLKNLSDAELKALAKELVFGKQKK
jgi:hypothetical protein